MTSEAYKERKRRDNRTWRENHPARHVFIHTRGNAAKKSIPFELTLDWVEERFAAGVCEVTGLALVMTEAYSHGHKHPFRPTIDRIDNSKGYAPGNCRVVCWIFNLAKADWTDEEVFTMARALINKHGVE